MLDDLEKITVVLIFNWGNNNMPHRVVSMKSKNIDCVFTDIKITSTVVVPCGKTLIHILWLVGRFFI